MVAFQPNYKHIRMRPEYQLQLHHLRRQLGRGGLDATQRARQTATEGIALQTQNAESAAKRSGAQAFGINNPTGVVPRLITEANMAAPFGAAELAAEQAGEGEMRAAGTQAMNVRQMMAGEYVSMMGPWLQEQALKQQAALGLAGMAGGGMGDLLSQLGPALGAYAGAGGTFGLGG